MSWAACTGGALASESGHVLGCVYRRGPHARSGLLPGPTFWGPTCEHLHPVCLRRVCAPCVLQFKRMPIHIAVAASNGAAKEMLLARALETHMEFAFWEQGHWYPYDEAAAHLLSFELGDGVGFAALALGEGATYIVDFSEHLQVRETCSVVCWDTVMLAVTLAATLATTTACLPWGCSLLASMPEHA